MKRILRFNEFLNESSNEFDTEFKNVIESFLEYDKISVNGVITEFSELHQNVTKFGILFLEKIFQSLIDAKKLVTQKRVPINNIKHPDIQKVLGKYK